MLNRFITRESYDSLKTMSIAVKTEKESSYYCMAHECDCKMARIFLKFLNTSINSFARQADQNEI